MSSQNICLHCGACCAYFRVSFYWGEADPSQGGKVPPDFIEEETEFLDNMKGTNQNHPYCAGLKGEIGNQVSCTIYANRPSPCIHFGLHYQDGIIQVDPDKLQRCNKARAAWNLPPLTKEFLSRPLPNFHACRVNDQRVSASKGVAGKKLGIRKLKQLPARRHHF